MYVLDASAILAVLLDEQGAAKVIPHLRDAEVSIVNVAEVLAKAAEKGADVDLTQDALDQFGFRTCDFRNAHARQSALLRPMTKAFGLGFGDRACIVQGMFSGRPILTGDRDWLKLDFDPALGIDIRLIR
jgi:PIN domain nuclease of toxin-antitoxin system